jgi:hypothetical protein
MTDIQIIFLELRARHPLVFMSMDNQIWFNAKRFSRSGLLVQLGTDTWHHGDSMLERAIDRKWSIYVVQTIDEVRQVITEWLRENVDIYDEVKTYMRETL